MSPCSYLFSLPLSLSLSYSHSSLSLRYNYAKFEVFQRLFEVFIMEFRTYGHLLKTIKDEYETYIDYLQKQASEQEELKAKLEIFERNAERQRKMIHAKAFLNLSQAKTKMDQLVCENQDLRAKLNQQNKYAYTRTHTRTHFPSPISLSLPL